MNDQTQVKVAECVAAGRELAAARMVYRAARERRKSAEAPYAEPSRQIAGPMQAGMAITHSDAVVICRADGPNGQKVIEVMEFTDLAARNDVFLAMEGCGMVLFAKPRSRRRSSCGGSTPTS